MATDWVTISSLATAAGTLVLACATFASVRSANRAARVAEESLLAGIRPLLVPSRVEDAPLKVGFIGDHLVRTPGGGGTAEVIGDAIYLTLSLRNAGNGIAVLHGWRFEPRAGFDAAERPAVGDFRRLTRDLYIAAGAVGFWQGALRNRQEPEWDALARRVDEGERFMVDLLYGDHQGGQRVISRFSFLSRTDAGWMATVSRH